MKTCPCSIFDAREEQIFEPSGSLCIRLICNVCGSILDSKVVRSAVDGVFENRGLPQGEQPSLGAER